MTDQVMVMFPAVVDNYVRLGSCQKALSVSYAIDRNLDQS